uniref:Uncharacterized protein n=1 Tax=Candidatus Aramenus sulfurataquae TaxID=1326980 RepID=A0A0F2LL13_9CREN
MFNNNWHTRFQTYVEGNSTVGRDAVIVYKNGNMEGVAGRLRIADNLNNILMNIEEFSRKISSKMVRYATSSSFSICIDKRCKNQITTFFLKKD